MNDPTDEIKAIRHQLGANFEFDLDRIYADILRRQTESGRKYVSRPPRQIADNKPLQPSGGSIASNIDTSSPAEG